MYNHDDAPNFASFAAAARAGNPDGIVCFNSGVKTPIASLTSVEDYTAGEVSAALPVDLDFDNLGVEGGRFVNGAQYHVMSYLGEFWGQGAPRFCDELAVGFTKQVIGRGGVVTWDVPIQKNGLFAEDMLRQMKVVGRGVEVGRSVMAPSVMC
jgi:hypothetical protein